MSPPKSILFFFLIYSSLLHALTVTNNNDSGAGSLRAAITTANTTPQNIDFSISNQTITLSSQLPVISNSYSIDGGNQNITISGNGASRLFYTTSQLPTPPAIKNLTLINGLAKGGNSGSNQLGGSGGGGLGAGGMLFVQQNSSITVENFTASGHTAQGGTAGTTDGGAPLATTTQGTGSGGGGLGGNGANADLFGNLLSFTPGVGGGGTFVGENGSQGSGSTGGAGGGTTGGQGGSFSFPALPGQGIGGGGGSGAFIATGGNSNGETGACGGGGGGGGNRASFTSSGTGGNGGFGAGGGGAGNNTQAGIGGFVGGNANSGPGGRGGGGGALGGAIFIQDGGALTLKTRVSFSGSGTSPGIGANSGQTLGTDVFIMSSGSLTIENLSVNSSIPSPIESDLGIGGGSTSTGGLTLGTGNTAIFTLNGVNTYTGLTTINSGSLYVQGSVITPVTATGGGLFGGNATLIVNGSIPNSGDLTINGGTVHPGGDNLFGTINVGRNLFLSGPCSLQNSEVDSLSNTDFIDVVGSATLDGTLLVEGATGNFIEGEVITIINATGGVTGTFSKEILPPTPGGTPLFQVLYNANSVQLLVLDNVLFDEQPIGSGNSQLVVDYILSQVPISPNSDFAFIVESLGLVANNKIDQALNLLHPGSFALFEWFNLTNNAEVMRIFSQHHFGSSSPTSNGMISQLEPSLTAASEGLPFYPDTPIRKGCNRGGRKHGVWVQPFGTWNTQSQKGELRGASYESAGVLAGYDYTFSQFSLGGGIGYTYTNFRWKGSAGKGHIDQVYGGVYGSYFIKYFAANLATMLGGNFYDTNRFIRWRTPGHPGGTVNRTAHSHNSGIQWTTHLGLIGDFSPFSVPLQIFANLDHFYLHNGRFNETGASSINLRVNAKISNALRSEIGLSSSYTFYIAEGCWTPYVRISWVNKTLLSANSMRGGFRGQVGTFSVSATSKGVNQVAPGMGIEFANKNGFSVLFNSRAELNGKMKNYSADMRINYAF